MGELSVTFARIVMDVGTAALVIASAAAWPSRAEKDYQTVVKT